MNNFQLTWKRRQFGVLSTAALAVLGVCGCENNRANVGPDNPRMGEFVRLMMPRKVEIQKYLTKPFAFGDTSDANGLEVILATLDAFGDPVKTFGAFQFDLSTRRMASGDKIGDRVAFWSVTIDSDKSLVEYWDHVTRYYRFPLQMSEGNLKPGDYVLTVRMVAPDDTKLQDEYEFAYQKP